MIYFLRHGQSEANVKKLFAGQKEDSPLTETGIEQAQQAGDLLLDKSITRIISSPLIRASKTAEIVAEILGIKKVEYNEAVLEYDMGSLTRTPLRKVTSLELIAAENAEDVYDFQKRVIDFLKNIANDSDNILIVSHAGVGRIIEATKLDKDPQTFYDLDAYPNAHAVELDLDFLK